MKTFRLSFEKGVNSVGDKAIIPEGFCSFIDNADLRSGSLKPVPVPEWQFPVASTTTRSWSYRGRWFHSASWRDYVGEFIGGIERVYVTEEGKYAKKVIGGVEALLGTPRPRTPPAVAQTTDLSPSGLSAAITYAGSGNLADGERLYRISAKTKYGIMPPCAPVSVTIADTGHVGAAVNLSWGAVPKATGYIIWEGGQDGQLRLDEVPPSTLTYIDTGAKTAAGDLASDYLSGQEFEYAYTYLRNVNGVYDESGMSALSPPLSAATGRLVTRDFQNDGYFDQRQSDGVTAAAVTGTGSIAATSAASYPPVSLNTVVVTYDSVTLMTKFAKTGHGFTTGDKGQFKGFTDPSWNNQIYEIVSIDANNFAVEGVLNPSDGATLGAAHSVQPAKCIVTYTASDEVETDDLVYVVGSGTGQSVDGLYKATRVNATTFTVPLLAAQTAGTITLSTVKWVPLNGYYWKWRVYRNDTGIWSLVEEVDLDETTYTDGKPFSALGELPTSFYSENGITVDYDAPPLGLVGIENHYGMKFGIVGHSVRWTPPLASDAWPEVFSVTLAYKPVALASFGQGLIILAQDAIYRLDGNQATAMSISKTHAEDGCFAPHSVQKTDKGLIYLSKRGIMLFNGTHAECLTDTRIPGNTLTAPSRLATTYNFWWMPTIMTRNYADFVGEDGIRGVDYSFKLDNTKVIEGYNKDVKSFYHQGKYYLFYTGSNYQANTAVCVDLQMPGFPITTLGMKILDAHVNETEQAFLLLDNAAAITTVSITSPE